MNRIGAQNLVTHPFAPPSETEYYMGFFSFNLTHIPSSDGLPDDGIYALFIDSHTDTYSKGDGILAGIFLTALSGFALKTIFLGSIKSLLEPAPPGVFIAKSLLTIPFVSMAGYSFIGSLGFLVKQIRR